MKRGFWGKKVPGIFGLFFIIVSLIATVYLVREGIIYLTGASPSEIPNEIKVTNITDSSFSVTYTTAGGVSGSINIGKTDDSEETVLDERDQLSESLRQYKTHIITPRNLIPSQKYKYSILSGSEKILSEGTLFEVETGPKIDESPSSQKPIVGKVITEEGDPSSDTLVYFSTEGSQQLSTITREDGSYILPLNSLRDGTLSSHFELNNESVIKLLITEGEKTSNVTLTIGQINPVPSVILSNDYDFTVNLNPLPKNELPEESFPKKEEGFTQDPEINTPEDNQSFTDQKPEFSGTAQPNAEIEIEIHSDENIKTKITADSSGSWEYRPSDSLSAGEHTITIKAKDSNGVLKTIMRRFTVFAQGTQVEQTATPSATLTPSPTPIPTIIASPTPTLTPSLPSSITAQPTIPPTGGETSLVGGLLGAGVAIFGVIIFILTRYKIPL
ncbi:MAG: hypothetical protein UU21_C0004G0036 [Candidatus Levybacteria bacterium GW2011_GWA2_40_8]|nr:MAG: hypothetical protein UU21_C0004G0036 [Candidatus Levybacteria bacterium GW2011_GWA2_40_8]